MKKTGLSRRVRKAIAKLNRLRQDLTAGTANWTQHGEEYRRLEAVIKVG